ncbi:hypothetical protein HFP57_17505 [Parasphingopyxis algicola]|uniref:hypothetical protein n=1 Tax=Parasphingopyxis algicola TaxID=2026624 RepID=UPI00159FDF94|nr:hypothetical protein [Parasphingopyxis algicola]QLC26654.1 hypothetical protein HFP57_17505 [Parasphingopyxis algicola]
MTVTQREALKQELLAVTDLCQQLEHQVGALLRENMALREKRAQLRAILDIAADPKAGESPITRKTFVNALTEDRAETAAALARAIASVAGDDIEGAIERSQIDFNETLKLDVVRMAMENSDRPQLGMDIEPNIEEADFAFDRFAKFRPFDRSSHAAVLLRCGADWRRWAPYTSCRLTFALRLTGYRKFTVQYRASLPMPRTQVDIGTSPWAIVPDSKQQNAGVEATFTKAADGWTFMEIKLPLDGGHFPILSIVPKLAGKGSDAESNNELPFLEIGMVGLDLAWEGDEDVDGMSLPADGSVRSDENASTPSGRIMPRVPILKGKLLSAAAAANAQGERQTQVEAFKADGEFSRIAALKNVHQGKRAFIIGNGPSLAQHDLSKLDGEITFVANWFANHPDFDALQPTYYAISSHEMFGGWRNPDPALNEKFIQKLMAHEHHPELFFSHRFKSVIEEDQRFERYTSRYLIFDQPKFLADEVGGLQYDLSLPMNDGYTVLLTFCLPLAVHMGISEIYMLGCDCDYGITSESDEGPRKYFYPASEHATSSTRASSIMRIWADDGPVFQVYEVARNQLAARGIEYFNATPGGRLNVLPRISLEEALAAGGRS